MVRQVRDEHRAHRWDKMLQWERERSEDWRRRSAQKLHCCSRYKGYPGTWDQTHRVVGDARDIRRLHKSYHQSTETRRTTQSSSSSDSTSSSSSTQAQGEIPRHVTVRTQAQIPEVNSRKRWGRMFLLYLPVVCLLSAATPELHFRSSTPTKRPAESMTLDVPSQAKHPQGEDPQMDVRSITVS